MLQLAADQVARHSQLPRVAGTGVGEWQGPFGFRASEQGVLLPIAEDAEAISHSTRGLQIKVVVEGLHKHAH